MVEYGGGISHGPAGQVSGGGGPQLGQNSDFFGSVGGMANNAMSTLSTFTPIEWLGLIVVVFVGLIILRKVFF
jgi:hypothetical protein